MNKRKISNYLKFGFTEDLWYNEPYSIIDISWEDAIDGYRKYYEEFINTLDISEALCALSGGLDSSLNIFYLKSKNPLVYSYIIEGNTDHIFAEKLAKYWNLKKFMLIKSNSLSLEEDLIKMNLMWPEPRCVTGDLHTYHAYIEAKKIKDILISGVGSEPMSLGIGWMYSPIIELAIRKFEYNCSKARKIFDKSNYIDPVYNNQCRVRSILYSKEKTYSSVIKDLFELGLFDDALISFMGLTPPELKLRNETLLDALQCTYDWYNPNMIGKRYPVLEKEIGLETITPYFYQPLRHFCFSLPIEYRFCLGSERHVMRNFIADKLPEFIINRPKEPFQPKIDWFFRKSKVIGSLEEEYLGSPNKRIFNYLDYENVSLIFPRMTEYQKWALLNLSIWLEAHLDD